MNKRAFRAYRKFIDFDPHGDKCPICKRDFQEGCEHTIQQAIDRLFNVYINEIVKNKG